MIETTVDGRYQLLARIASGGMGEVYRAHDPVLDRDVAVKMLHAPLAGDDAFIDRFRREARAAAMLNHPNIVHVHDWGQTGDTYFMVMEFVHGPNLRAILAHHGALQPAQGVEAMSQVLAALGHAHERGIIHRDIKPENILVTPEGVAKVADFGLARALAESRVSTAPGTVTGTVQYLAPEQIQGEAADARTDLYAVGIALYELLTGEVPFTGETSVAIAYQHLQQRVPPPSKANPMVPPALDRAVRDATEPDRARRTDTARRLRADLTASLPELPPAPPLVELVRGIPRGEETADRAATVTIPRAVAPRARRRRRLRRVAKWGTALALVATAAWASWTYAIPHIDVPDLRGKTVDAATAETEAAGLTLVVSRQMYSPTVEAGAIVGQDPSATERVRRGTKIDVIVSRGPQLVRVPNVKGEKRDGAERILRRAGLEVTITQDFHQSVKKGRVIKQQPGPATTIEAGETVKLVVSKGKPPVDVPNVVGRSESDAGDILQALGLGVRITQDHSNKVKRGLVISQSPVEGTTVKAGATVEIVVSKGPRKFPMPDVIGMSKDAALAKLRNLGLDVTATQVPGSSGNRVVGQRPSKGTTMRAGDDATIYIGGN